MLSSRGKERSYLFTFTKVKIQHDPRLSVIGQWIDFALRKSLTNNFAWESTVKKSLYLVIIFTIMIASMGEYLEPNFALNIVQVDLYRIGSLYKIITNLYRRIPSAQLL